VFSSPARMSRAIVTGAALVACADGAPPTQPLSRSTAAAAASPKAAPDVTTDALPSVIYACYTPKKGSIYRIKTGDTAAECDKQDIEFSWSDQGVPGPQGPTGPQGPQGEPGPKGPAGSGAIAGLTFISAQVTLPATGRYNALCATGKSLVNFGYEPTSQSAATTATIIGNRPVFGFGQVGWGFRAAPGTEWVFYWTCADADPAVAAP
jgi:hypothetical protein